MFFSYYPWDETNIILVVTYLLVEVALSGILKGKRKLGVTFNSDKLGGIDFTKFSKLSMCSAGAGKKKVTLLLQKFNDRRF